MMFNKSSLLFITLFIYIANAQLNENKLNDQQFISSTDLEELNPNENNCFIRETSLNGNKQQRVICSKVPLFCRNVCDTLKQIDFGPELKKLSSFSFSSYQVKQTLDLNFKSLELIDSDAFNGLIIESDVQLRINVENSLVYDDENDVSLPENELYDQIESDIQVPATKSGKTENEKKGTRDTKRNLIIATNAFRGINIKQGGKLIIRVNNYDKVEFTNKSLYGIMNMPSSSTLIEIGRVNLVLFRSECVQSNTNDEYDLDYNDIENSNDLKIQSYSFKINIMNVKQVLFEKDSFSFIEQANASTFQLIVNKFDTIKLGKSSFQKIKQSKGSNFEINFSNGNEILLSEAVFSDLKQDEQSKFILYFNVNQASMCLKENIFSNLLQGLNSTFRLTFAQMNNLLINKGSFKNLKQNVGSFVQIYALRPENLVIESESFENFTQEKLSAFEIWASKSNFTIKPYAFKRLVQNRESAFKIGLSSGNFDQSPILFDQFTALDASNTRIAYDFTQDTNFNLNFPPRPSPRILLTTSDENQDIELLTWKMFPNLGRQSRPDILNLYEYKVNKNDFCKFAKIPSDVFVQIKRSTECSCAVYYLYRFYRKTQMSSTNWLNQAPECYQKAFLNQDIKALEDSCKFNELLVDCNEKLNEWTNVDKLVVLGCDSGSFEKYSDKSSNANQVETNDNIELYDINSDDESENYSDYEEDAESVIDSTTSSSEDYEDDNDDFYEEEINSNDETNDDASEEPSDDNTIVKFEQLFKNPFIFVFAVVFVIIFSLISVSIVLLIVWRCKRKTYDFLIYNYEEYEDLTDNDEDFNNRVSNMRKESFKYNRLEEGEQMNKKSMIVKCEKRSNSIDSSILENPHQQIPNHMLVSSNLDFKHNANHKSNPFSFI